MNQIVVIVISICILAAAVIIALKVVEKDKGEYECNTCQNKFEPKFIEIILSMYSDNTRYLNCTNCKKKSWCKKL